MVNIVNQLKEETKELLILFLERTEEFAKKEFVTLRKFANEYTSGIHGFGEASLKYHRLPYYIVNPNGKVEDHVSKMVKNAELHYENSILKLAERLSKKGLDLDNLTMVTSTIGVNIETLITDGVKTVKAFTIIAEGVIQKPHYRYLIK